MSTDKEIASEFAGTETAKQRTLRRLLLERGQKRARERDEAFVYVTPRARSGNGRYHSYRLGDVNLNRIRPTVEHFAFSGARPDIIEIWRNRIGQIAYVMPGHHAGFTQKDILVERWQVFQVNWQYGPMVTRILRENGVATMQMQRKWTRKDPGRGASRGEYQCYLIAGILSGNGMNRVPDPLVAGLSTGVDL